jgi:2-oxoisovalerate dehydrogenase E2 component (dihydrolipoyl transacylase)
MSIFKLPDLGEGLPDAEIREWYVQEGDEVKLDQPLVSMETAKALVDIPSPFAGHIRKLYGKAGDVIPTNAPLIEFILEGASPARAAHPSAKSATVVGEIITSDTLLEESPTGVAVQTTGSNQVRATPSIRALASKLNVDLSQIKGTGARGTITANDVTSATISTSPTPISRATIGEPLQSVRRIMAQQMTKSHQEVVPVTLVEDADLYQWPENIDVSARLIRAIAAAAKAEPVLNAHFYGESLSIKIWDEVNIGIAVDTKAGLYVPVIKDADKKSAADIRKVLDTFKQKALTQSFTPEDLKQATITLSNFGTITGRYASPIVTPPTVAIIGVGKSRPMVVAQDGKPVIHAVMPISLTFDHRAATGGEAARFLAAFIADLASAS